MELISSALMKRKLNFQRLSECHEDLLVKYIQVISRWVEDEWGYILNNGLEARKKKMDGMKENIFIGTTINDSPVAMFALLPGMEFDAVLLNTRGADQLPRTRNLMYVYVEEGYRGFGYGRQIIDEAKKRAGQMGAELILLDTLKHGLNRMYERQGAERLREHDFYSYPSEEFVMRV